MNKSIKIKHISGRIIDAKIRRLTNRDLDKILLLQDFIYESMVDKSLFAKTEKEEFENMINNNGEVIGVVTEDDELIVINITEITHKNFLNIKLILPLRLNLIFIMNIKPNLILPYISKLKRKININISVYGQYINIIFRRV